MKTFLLRYKWKLLFAFVLLIIVVPFGINCLYKLTPPCNFIAAEWDAGDALAFYGAMLASATTIAGVYISIEYAQKNYRIDEANRVKPYFALTYYNSHTTTNLLSSLPLNEKNEAENNQPQESEYEEYKLERVYIVIEKTKILFQGKLSSAQQNRLRSGGFEWENQGDGHHILQPHPFVSVPFEVENVGNGAATNVMVAFYEKGAEPKGVNLYTIKQGTSFYFHVFCDDTEFVTEKKYTIELLYGDTIGNYYTQKYPLTFSIDAETKKLRTLVDLEGKQEVKNTEEN